MVLAARFSRRLEHRADRIARDAQPGEGAYARALARVHEVNLSPVVAPGKGSSHPHLYDRLMAVGAPPDYPRPKAPSARRLHLGRAAVVSAWLVLVVDGIVARLPWGARAQRSEAAIV